MADKHWPAQPSFGRIVMAHCGEQALEGSDAWAAVEAEVDCPKCRRIIDATRAAGGLA